MVPGPQLYLIWFQGVQCTHCGNVVQAGLEAAQLAARGLTANPAIFSAPHGSVDTFFMTHFDYELLMQFGEPYRCVDPGMAIKFYPSKYPTQFAIAAAVDSRGAVPVPSRIRPLRLTTPEITDAHRPQPCIGLEGKFSFQFVAAAVLLDGEISRNTFTDKRRFRADMKALLGKITITQDASIPKDTRRMHITIEVTLDDGTVVSRTCRKPPGTWGEPIPETLHRAKISACLAQRFDADVTARVIDKLGHLEKLSTPDVAELCALLACQETRLPGFVPS